MVEPARSSTPASQVQASESKILNEMMRPAQLPQPDTIKLHHANPVKMNEPMAPLDAMELAAVLVNNRNALWEKG